MVWWLENDFAVILRLVASDLMASEATGEISAFIEYRHRYGLVLEI